ncbi:MAG: YceI family protein [Nakamurella sp.]
MTTSLASSTLTAGTWTADAAHSDISFTVRHMAVGKVRGTFAINSATLYVGASGIAQASATAEIDATSVDTKQKQRDADVRSANFLDVDNHPTISFISTAIKDFDGDTFLLAGVLTIRGITNQVELAAEFLGETVDLFGFTRSGFTATTTISRKAYGVKYDALFGAGNAVVADNVEIAMDLEFIRSSD